MDEITSAMKEALDRVKLDADMRAMAEDAMHHCAPSGAEGPDAAMVVSEAMNADGGGEGQSQAPLPPPLAPLTPPTYQPNSPFRLKFTFGSDGSWAGITMEDADFLWCDTYKDENNKVKPRVTSKTASVGSLSLTGTVYLNITLDSNGKYSSSSVDMSSSGDMSVKLYVLENGVVKKDYRHALVTLCGAPAIGGGEDEDEKTKTVLTGLTWNNVYHKLVISSADVTYKNGLMTKWEDNDDEYIETTDISSIIS